jgi:dipeptidase E
MRLLLSSHVLGEAPRPPVLPPAVTGRAGIILNALDQYGATRTRHLGREASTLGAWGYACEELDLRTYFAAPDALADRLAALDMTWALGGNAFVLARAMNAAGFGPALRRHPGGADFVYGGYSAGACVAGPDLRGVDLMDEPGIVPEGYPPHVPPECLGLVPFRIVPHWRSDHPEAAAAERAATWLARSGLAYRCLRDGQVMAQDGGLSPPVFGALAEPTDPIRV